MRNRINRRIESELRANRAQPRADFAKALAEDVRSRPMQRSPLGRIGLAFALSGLIVVALASFGGVGYASSSASHAVKKPTVAKRAFIVSKKSSSAAQAQYGDQVEQTFTPPKAVVKATPKATPQAAQVAGQATAASVAPKAKSGQLPFTGLALWVPLAGGLALIAFGLVLRTRTRKHGSAAH
jgi:hypothetical protein